MTQEKQPTKLLAVRRRDRTAIDNARVLRDRGRDRAREERADVLVRGLRLRGARDLARPDRPHGLVRDDDLGPVLRLEGRDDGLQLRLDDGLGALGLALLERLADAEDDAQAGVDRGARLVRDERGGLVEERAALGVA